jgi:hypothetical protein
MFDHLYADCRPTCWRNARRRWRWEARKEATMAEIALIEAVTQALAYELAHDPSAVVLGEDVGVNGGVFRATAGLQKRFGAERVSTRRWTKPRSPASRRHGRRRA